MKKAARPEPPLVGVVMGSTSDWETMQHAAETLERFGVPLREARRVGAPHAEAPRRVRGRGRGAGLEVIIAGAGRRRPPARHARGADGRARPRRPRREPRARGPRLAALDRADARRRPRRHARDRQGRRDNAALLAIAILSNWRPATAHGSSTGLPLEADRRRSAVRGSREIVPPGSASASSAAGSSGACSRSRPARWATACTPTRRRKTRRRATSRTSKCPRRTTTSTPARVREGIDVVTFEFENVPRAALDEVERLVPVHPSAEALWVSQNREREKEFLRKVNVPLAPWATGAHEFRPRCRALHRGRPLRAQDGRLRVRREGTGEDFFEGYRGAARAWSALGQVPCVLESFIEFQREISVIAARGADGRVAFFPIFENEHSRHILDVTTAPAPLSLSKKNKPTK